MDISGHFEKYITGTFKNVYFLFKGFFIFKRLKILTYKKKRSNQMLGRLKREISFYSWSNYKFSSFFNFYHYLCHLHLQLLCIVVKHLCVDSYRL